MATGPSQGKEPSHGHFMLLLHVTGADAGIIDRSAREIHEAYMAKYGEIGAFTAELLDLIRMIPEGTNAETRVGWNIIVRYFGPVASVGWLQERLEYTAKRENAKVVTQTFMVRDVTGRY